MVHLMVYGGNFLAALEQGFLLFARPNCRTEAVELKHMFSYADVISSSLQRSLSRFCIVLIGVFVLLETYSRKAMRT